VKRELNVDVPIAPYTYSDVVGLNPRSLGPAFSLNSLTLLLSTNVPLKYIYTLSERTTGAAVTEVSRAKPVIPSISSRT